MTPTSRQSLARAAIVVASLLLTLLVVELGFRLFVVRSDGFGHTLASRQWDERYWKPINRYGFRDRDYPEDEVPPTRKKLFVRHVAAGQPLA